MLVKLRFRFPEIAFGMLLAVAIFAMGAMFWSSQSPSSQPDSTTKTENAADQQKQKEGWREPLVVVTLLLAIVGMAQLGLFYQQLVLIRRGLKPAEVAAKAAKESADALPAIERAYVFIDPSISFTDKHLVYGDQPSSGIRPEKVAVTFSVINHGKTPAIVKSIDARLEILPNPPDNRTHLIVDLTPDRILVPGVPYSPPSSPRTRDIDKETWRAIENDEAAVWFYGSICYDDMFGKERWTRFRWSQSEILDLFSPRGEAPYNERT